MAKVLHLILIPPLQINNLLSLLCFGAKGTTQSGEFVDAVWEYSL